MNGKVRLKVIWLFEEYEFDAEWETIDGVQSLKASLNGHPNGARIIELMQLGAEPASAGPEQDAQGHAQG